ncbi:pirin-like C-terminal cupin domain-containing protein [Suipraeoptans intestinalis]
MTKPAYRSIKRDQIPEVELEGGRLRILAGSYDGQQGVQGNYQPIDYYDITVEPGKTVTIPQRRADRRCCFLCWGCTVAGEDLEEKTAALLSDGDQVTIEGKEKRAKVLFLSGSPLKEEIAWEGRW